MEEQDIEDPMAYADASADADAEYYGSRESIETEDDDGAKKSDVPAALRKAKGDKDWRVSTQDLEKEKERNISSKEWLKKHNEASDDKEKDEDPPFDPDEEPSSDKDEYGNVIKHKAKHLARKGMRQAMDVKELAEFISSFYDKDSGTFPKGPEGVATMVGKKFGEQAEHAARKMVERMAPQQADPQIQELNRIRELSGMQIEQAAHQFKKGDRVVFKGKSDEYEIAGLAAQGDDPNTVYIRKPGATPTQGAVANSLELAKGAQGSQPAANQFNKGEIVGYSGKLAQSLGSSVIYRHPSQQDPNVHWIDTIGGPYSVSIDDLKPLDGKTVPIPVGGLDTDAVKKILGSGTSSTQFQKGEIVKYSGQYTDHFGDSVIYRSPTKNDPNKHWVDTVGGPWDVSSDDLKPLDGKTVPIPAGGLDAAAVKKILGAPSQSNTTEKESVTPELEDIKRLSGISQGMGF